MRTPLLLLVLGCAPLFLACKDGGGPAAGGSAAPSAPAPGGSANDDVLPAIEVTTPRPSFALADLTDKQLEKLVARAGWTPTIVGKSPPAEGQSTIRVGAYRKTGQQQHDAVVLVRCKKQEERAAAFQPGEAWFKDGACLLTVAVRLGIRNKSAESKALLEALLAGSTG